MNRSLQTHLTTLVFEQTSFKLSQTLHFFTLRQYLLSASCKPIFSLLSLVRHEPPPLPHFINKKLSILYIYIVQTYNGPKSFLSIIFLSFCPTFESRYYRNSCALPLPHLCVHLSIEIYLLSHKVDNWYFTKLC